ncbi:hypothetical protein M406DRAFT_352638 [Cryphonectria parasitica EP155]|uniref:Uncharacterized protein n=1 Tax=Cryphonectria parasitica (strain ATCC 38755 / EP155) TaxID=660469 RepID=A0A9P5CKF4_CRYP1|nr:uncharacterized protein M406DRAFT_352638 [Cryphonectria parasitica EP155]KAF3762184.1 hypothetical protein M406DRAFT_352638 [Cryphonectria parasitica EP155]
MLILRDYGGSSNNNDTNNDRSSSDDGNRDFNKYLGHGPDDFGSLLERQHLVSPNCRRWGLLDNVQWIGRVSRRVDRHGGLTVVTDHRSGSHRHRHSKCNYGDSLGFRDYVQRQFFVGDIICICLPLFKHQRCDQVQLTLQRWSHRWRFAVALLAIIGFLVYRFRRSPFMQRALAPFRKGSRDSSSHIGPYYHMEKDDGTAPNMTGETLIGTSNMRAMGPVGAATTSANPNNLTVDTNHLQGRSVWPVSPISPQSRSAASDVSPVSPDPTMFPLQQPSPISNPEPGTAISVAGSEARIVSIPARQSRVLGDGGSGVGGDAVPAAEWRPPPMRGPPSTRAAVVPSSTRGPSRRNPARRPSRSSAGGRGGGSYRHPAQWTDGSEDLRPPPLSINKYPTMMASHAPVAELNGGYKAYRPMLGSGNAAAARSLTQNRVSHASTGASSIASSDAFSPEAWPMPPGTPRTSPGRH